MKKEKNIGCVVIDYLKTINSSQLIKMGQPQRMK